MYVNILATLQIGRKNLHYITAMKFFSLHEVSV